MNYVISDIHGCYEEFMELLEKISFSEEDNLFILGDVLDRGPSPIKTMQEIMNRKNITFLVFNYSTDIYIKNLNHKIQLSELENYIKSIN